MDLARQIFWSTNFIEAQVYTQSQETAKTTSYILGLTQPPGHVVTFANKIWTNCLAVVPMIPSPQETFSGNSPVSLAKYNDIRYKLSSWDNTKPTKFMLFRFFSLSYWPFFGGRIKSLTGSPITKSFPPLNPLFCFCIQVIQLVRVVPRLILDRSNYLKDGLFFSKIDFLWCQIFKVIMRPFASENLE